MDITDSARELLTTEGYDRLYGARPLKRVIQQRIQNGLANRLLAGEFPQGSRLVVDGQADGFVFTACDPDNTAKVVSPLPTVD